MAHCKSWVYPKTAIVQKCEDILAYNTNNPQFNKWYTKPSLDGFVYVNSKWFYHVVTVSKQDRWILTDYLVNKNGELTFSKEYEFNSKQEIREFLDEKTGANIAE